MTKIARPSPFNVVVAFIHRGGRVLLEQREATVEFPLHWACPGGKVEPGETDAQALVRELREELGLQLEEASVGDCLWTLRFAPPLTRSDFIVRTLEVTLPPDAKPMPLTAAGLGWFQSWELISLRVVPSLKEVRGEMIAFLDTPGRQAGIDRRFGMAEAKP